MHVGHKHMVGGSSMIGFIAVSEQDMPGIKPGQLGWHTSALTERGITKFRSGLTKTG
jgi:hypothetical protein